MVGCGWNDVKCRLQYFCDNNLMPHCSVCTIRLLRGEKVRLVEYRVNSSVRDIFLNYIVEFDSTISGQIL